MKKWWQQCKLSKWIELSSPVTLLFTLAALVVWLLGVISGGGSTRLLFSVYRSSAVNIFFWPRLFLHVLGHKDFAHYAANIAMILVLGPLVERHYGSRNFLIMILITALGTALAHLLLAPTAMGMGASGLVFMLIMLSAISGRSQGKLPLTMILVALIFLGGELATGLFTKDNISQLAHIVGGLCGIAFGLLSTRRTAKAKP